MPNEFEDVLAQYKGNYEPQRQHTWLITVFDLKGKDVIELSLRMGFLPSENNEEIELPYMNGRVYVAGKYMVDAGTITLHDFVDKNTMGVMAAWRRQVYDSETGAIGWAKDYKKQAEIILYGPSLQVERTWKIVGLWPQQVNFGTIDYSSSDVVQIEGTFRYDKAIFQNIPS